MDEEDVVPKRCSRRLHTSIKQNRLTVLLYLPSLTPPGTFLQRVLLPELRRGRLGYGRENANHPRATLLGIISRTHVM